ncbi:hypothetical protein RFI_21598 [Reticulomyxa filosa]|uniref:Uncharacterized protein n=1 Tax=Reticulomyxa filosa TaxID=46433 RepID=X6MQ35_RETFI|nr:hypothetical protein RFI_21598 [Reticulomyxa filosa]|eukprot:ETO15766.1 hypothetical protein RFI_21598 [Reticulomyxa filosa]
MKLKGIILVLIALDRILCHRVYIFYHEYLAFCQMITVSIHVKAKLRVCDVSQLVMICLFILMKQKYIYCMKLRQIINYKQSKNEITSIIEYWIRILKIKLVWIDDFDKIIKKIKS